MFNPSTIRMRTPIANMAQKVMRHQGLVSSATNSTTTKKNSMMTGYSLLAFSNTIIQDSIMNRAYGSMTTTSSSSSSFLLPKKTPTTSRQSFASLAVAHEQQDDYYGPTGDLFDWKRGEGIQEETLLGRIGQVRRVFGPNSNAHGLLACGGEDLARHASFDPNYSRARGWIQTRAIGDAVLSPVLISGLVGALVEAAFPQSVPVMSSMHQARPLIVGQEVTATIRVLDIKHFTFNSKEVSIKEQDFGRRQEGHEIRLSTEVIRTQDMEIIAEGSHSVWIPGYLSR